MGEGEGRGGVPVSHSGGFCRLAKTACKFSTCVILFMRLPQLFHRVSLRFADTLYMPWAAAAAAAALVSCIFQIHECIAVVCVSCVACPIVLSLAAHANCCQLGFSSELDAVWTAARLVYLCFCSCCCCCCFCFLINYCWHHFEGVVAAVVWHVACVRITLDCSCCNCNSSSSSSNTATAFATATSCNIYNNCC